MDISYEDIRGSFERVRDYFSFDLRLLSNEDHGGNYVTALLICCVSETLSRLKYGKKNGVRFFAEEMLPDKWWPVAPNLFDAMRNGIAHFYETKRIRVRDKVIDIYISWREKPHLEFSDDKARLYLNIQSMAGQTLKLLERYEVSLKADSKLRSQWYEAMRAIKVQCSKKVEGDELKAWENLMGVKCSAT